MKSFGEFIIEGRGGKPKYSDEYANINFYNHLVGSLDTKGSIGKKCGKQSKMRIMKLSLN